MAMKVVVCVHEVRCSKADSLGVLDAQNEVARRLDVGMRAQPLATFANGADECIRPKPKLR